MRTESVERAASILMAFSTQNARLCLADLARETGLHHFSGEDVEDLSVFNANGTVVSAGVRNPSIASIATPVFDVCGNLRGALTVSGLINRFDEASRAQAVPMLEQLVRELKASLGPSKRLRQRGGSVSRVSGL